MWHKAVGIGVNAVAYNAVFRDRQMLKTQLGIRLGIPLGIPLFYRYDLFSCKWGYPFNNSRV